MRLSQHKLCTKRTVALEVLDFHWVIRHWSRTVTNGRDVKDVFPRCRTWVTSGEELLDKLMTKSLIASALKVLAAAPKVITWPASTRRCAEDWRRSQMRCLVRRNWRFWWGDFYTRTTTTWHTARHRTWGWSWGGCMMRLWRQWTCWSCRPVPRRPSRSRPGICRYEVCTN